MENHLPASFLDSFKRFEEWHWDIQASLRTSEADSKDLVLDNIRENYATFKEKYMSLIRNVAMETYSYSDEIHIKVRETFKRSSIYPFYLQAPYYNQIIRKPRGYAGDAEMMQIIYRNRFEGETPMGQLLHKIGTECEGCQAVRNRRKLLTNIIKRHSGAILSLAAGPASEIFDTFSDQTKESRTFLAIDHDIETLKSATLAMNGSQFSYGIANAFQLLKGNSVVLYPRKQFLERCDPVKDTTGIRKLILPAKYKISKLKKENFHLVYSAGLYDYIKSFENKKQGNKSTHQTAF